MAGSKNNNPLVSIVIVTYNSSYYIENCLRSLLRIEYKPVEIIIVDCASNDDTLKILSRYEKKINLIKSGKNLGYSGGCNLGAKNSSGKYLLFLNPDTVVDIKFLKPLVAKIEKEDEKTVACQPLVYLLKEKKINLSGKITNYLGFDWVRDFNETNYSEDKELVSLSGSAFLIKSTIFQKAGGYDELYFMYYEDTDLSWRLRLMGFNFLFVPESIVYHDYKYVPKEEYLSMKKKIYLNERNRIITLLKNYSTKTLIIILPAFLIMELSLFVYFWFKGWFTQKILSYIFILKNLKKILRQRKFVQDLRKVEDKIIVRGFVSTLDYVYYQNIFVKYLINPIMFIFWNLVRRLV